MPPRDAHHAVRLSQAARDRDGSEPARDRDDSEPRQPKRHWGLFFVRLIVQAWTRYLGQLQKRPLETKAITAGCLAMVSDLVAQISTPGDFDWRRSIALGVYGLLVTAPCAHYWTAFLEHCVPHRPGPMSSLKRTALDQIFYAPIANLGFFTWTTFALDPDGWTWQVAREEIVSQFPGVQLRGWRVWPVASFVNQEFIPLELRVLWINLVALGWQVFVILTAKAALPRRLGMHTE